MARQVPQIKKNELSVIVQASDSTSVAVKSDLSKLTELQNGRLQDFLESIVSRQQEKIKEIGRYPYVAGPAYQLRAYPVGPNRNYERAD